MIFYFNLVLSNKFNRLFELVIFLKVLVALFKSKAFEHFKWTILFNIEVFSWAISNSDVWILIMIHHFR